MKKGIYNKLIFSAVLVFVSVLFAQELTKVFTASNGALRVTTPADWEEIVLNDAADIQAGNLQKEQYFILISEAKADLYGWNLKKHSYVTLGNLVAGLNDPQIKGPIEMEINEQPAIQYEIEGSTSGLRIVYLHTTVESDSAYNQLLAWTLRSKYSENKSLLKDVINTFTQTR